MVRHLAFAIALLALAAPAVSEPPEGKGKKVAVPTFMLRDCGDLACDRDPSSVGTVISVFSSAEFVLTRVPFTDSQGEVRNVGLLVRQDGIAFLGGAVLFDDLGCTGPAWIDLRSLASRQFAPAFSTTRIVNDTFSPEIRALYVATEEIPVVVTKLSFAQSNGCQSPGTTEDVMALPAENLADDLHEIFPPPFTLEVE